MPRSLQDTLAAARTIDLHAHIVLAETEGAAGSYGPEVLFEGEVPIYRIGDYELRGVQYRGSAFMDSEIRLQRMDQAGIDVQVLTPNPLTYFHYIEPDLALQFSQTHNDALAVRVQEHPERLLGMANLPLQDCGAAREELFRAVEDLGLHGAAIGTASHHQLDDPYYDVLYDAFEVLQVPLLIHPAPTGIDRPLLDESLSYYELDLMVGFSFQETVAVANLIFGGVLERHPGLHVCISHGGGMLPFIAGRLSKASRKRAWVPQRLQAEGAFEEELGKLWYDSHVHSEESLDLLEKVVGPDRIVYGTNFAGWDQPAAYTPDERTDQWTRNARNLFRVGDA
ncbi:MAG: amidohydrolase family protein [bacterium]